MKLALASAPPPRLARNRHLDLLCLQARRLRALPRLATAAAGDVERFLGLLCLEGPSLLSADACAVFVDGGDGRLRPRAAHGFGAEALASAALAPEDIAALVAEFGEIARLDGPAARLLWPSLFADGLVAAMWVPVRFRGEMAGGLLFGTRTRRAGFAEDDVLFAEVLATFLGGCAGELRLAQRVASLERTLADQVSRIARPPAAATAAPAPIPVPVPADDEPARRLLAPTGLSQDIPLADLEEILDFGARSASAAMPAREAAAAAELLDEADYEAVEVDETAGETDSLPDPGLIVDAFEDVALFLDP